MFVQQVNSPSGSNFPGFRHRIVHVKNGRGRVGENQSKLLLKNVNHDGAALICAVWPARSAQTHRSHRVRSRGALHRANPCGGDGMRRGLVLRAFCGAKRPAQLHEALDLDCYRREPGVENSKAVQGVVCPGPAGVPHTGRSGVVRGHDRRLRPRRLHPQGG